MGIQVWSFEAIVTPAIICTAAAQSVQANAAMLPIVFASNAAVRKSLFGGPG